MSAIRPAGMSSDDSDSNDDFEYGCFNKKPKQNGPPPKAPSCPDPKQSNVPSDFKSQSKGVGFRPGGISRGRGKGVPTVPWEWESDEESEPVQQSLKVHEQHQQPSHSSSRFSNSGLGTSKMSRPLPLQSGYNPSQNRYHPLKIPELATIPYIDVYSAELCYKNLKLAWNAVEENEMSKICRNAYSNCENPFSLALYLMVHSPDFRNPHGSKLLCNSVLQELKNYLTENDGLQKFISPDLQKLAIRLVISHKKSALQKLVVEIFRILEIREEMVQQVKDLSSENLYKEACSAASALELFCFDVHEFVVPLVLQDRINYVEEYFQDENSKQMREDLVLFLDKIASERGVTNALYNYIDEKKLDLEEIKKDKLNGKVIEKLVKRLASKYQLDPSTFPHVKSRQKLGELRHIFYRMYTETSDMQEDNFHEIVADMVKDDVEMIEEAFYLLNVHAGYQAITKFIQGQNIRMELIPRHYLHLIETAPLTSNIVCEEENWEDDTPISKTSSTSTGVEQSYETTTAAVMADWEPKRTEFQVVPLLSTVYAIPISPANIRVVSTSEGAKDFSEYLQRELQQHELVITGFDSEWKPVQSKSASLLQIAFKNQIYLIDLLAFKHCESESGVPMPTIFEILLKQFFSNEKVLKIAYDAKNDFKMLTTVDKRWECITQNIKAVFDLRSVQAEIHKRNSSFFPPSNCLSDRGLSEMVHVCLKKTLSKAEQFSDWEKRPLRDSQVTYAAADAYCLIEIYDFLLEREKEIPIRLTEIIQACVKQSNSQIRKIRVPVEVVRAVLPFKRGFEACRDDSLFKVPLPVGDAIFICDTMLEGVGRQLRSCGVHTIILDRTNMVTEENILRQCKPNKTFVITRGRNRYEFFVDQFPTGHVLYVSSDMVVDQIQEIFGYFNIIADLEDGHTVCWNCNSSEFIAVSKNLMYQLLQRKGFRTTKALTENALESLRQRISHDMITFTGNIGRKWNIRPQSDIVIKAADHRLDSIAYTAKTSTAVDINRIPVHLFQSINGFYVCSECGKCYWDSEKLETMLFSEETSGESKTEITPSTKMEGVSQI